MVAIIGVFVFRHVFIAGVVLGVAFLTALFGFGKKSNVKYNEDAVIVLGAGIQGEKVSESLKNPLDAAPWYYHKNPKVILPGIRFCPVACENALL